MITTEQLESTISTLQKKLEEAKEKAKAERINHLASTFYYAKEFYERFKIIEDRKW